MFDKVSRIFNTFESRPGKKCKQYTGIDYVESPKSNDAKPNLPQSEKELNLQAAEFKVNMKKEIW